MACIALAVFGAQAQIKVHSDNRVSLGSTELYCPPHYKVYTNGNAYVSGDLKIESLSFKLNTGYILGPVIIATTVYGDLWFRQDFAGNMGLFPEYTLGGSLGSSTNKFSKIYTYQMYYDYSYSLSDKRKKENITDIDKPLAKLLQVKGHKYDFITENLDSIKSPKQKEEIIAANKNHLGFLAQDLQQIIPEAVKYDEADDTYYIDYNAMIPVLVEAIKELSAQIDELKKETINEKSAVIGSSTTPDGSEAATLAQNIPNPFSSTTRNDIYLPASVTKATLYVYTMQGAQVKSIPVTGRGNTQVILDGFTLDAGMYLYTLIADGKEVDTKKMILTK